MGLASARPTRLSWLNRVALEIGSWSHTRKPAYESTSSYMPGDRAMTGSARIADMDKYINLGGVSPSCPALAPRAPTNATRNPSPAKLTWTQSRSCERTSPLANAKTVSKALRILGWVLRATRRHSEDRAGSPGFLLQARRPPPMVPVLRPGAAEVHR